MYVYESTKPLERNYIYTLKIICIYSYVSYSGICMSLSKRSYILCTYIHTYADISQKQAE